jgi:hypothetical protein
MKDSGKLRFVRIDRPDLFQLIPKYLFEQTKDADFNVDLLYRSAGPMLSNPLLQLYAMVDDQSMVKGVFWAFVNMFEMSIQVYLLSVNKEYQDGNVCDHVKDFIKTWIKRPGKMKLVALTSRPKAYEKHGMKRTNRVLMEMQL